MDPGESLTSGKGSVVIDELEHHERGGSTGYDRSCVYFKHALQQMFAYK